MAQTTNEVLAKLCDLFTRLKFARNMQLARQGGCKELDHFIANNSLKRTQATSELEGRKVQLQ
jgi:hypothetical protein